MHAYSSFQLPPPDRPPASQGLTLSHSCEQMSSSIVELKEAMAKVESSIAKLEEKIDALQPQITEATRMALESGVDQQRWGVREEQLRKKENHLLARLAEQEKRLAEQEKQKGHLLAQSAGGSQQGPTLDPGLVTRLAEVVDYFLEKKASMLLSNATTRNKDELLQLLSLRERGASWDKKPEDADLPDFTSHEWLAVDVVQHAPCYPIRSHHASRSSEGGCAASPWLLLFGVGALRQSHDSPPSTRSMRCPSPCAQRHYGHGTT
ncbi:hypothetical protein AB1Y20_018838 [Prymnesium parvum]|uniref:Kinetochore protein Spc24 n=1 Tax=Prymnesium parvum TaxID=97485 RepID=A0AB34JPC2_PRYPA